MSTNVSRRNFLLGSAASAGLLGLAACNGAPTDGGTSAGTSAASGFEAPSADKYPIDPDGEGVEALWTSEETKDGWTRVTNPEGGVTLGVMDAARIIQVDGLAFRDMDGDGKLSLFEDWRQTPADRAAALAEAIEVEDIFPLMWAGGTQAMSTTTDTSAFDFIEAGSRAGVSRLSSNPDSYAADVKWINSVQEVCEKNKWGIPYLNYSDPYVLFDVPGSFGLSTIMDKDVWRKAGMWQARAWRATGVRTDLGPQIDVYSNPIGTRCSGSVCEDPAVNRDFIQAFGGGMQSTWGDDEATDDLGWGPESCGVMLKHFVGEGSNEGGRDDHSDMGKWDVFPGNNFNAHLIPFLDGGFKLDSKTEQAVAVMPCYGIAYDPSDPDLLGEHVGSAYSAHNMSILRSTGWDGMICTDWMIINGTDHGVNNVTLPERFAKLMKNSISEEGGDFLPDLAAEGYQLLVDDLGEEQAEKIMRTNARRFFQLEATVDLFDQPYSDRSVAKDIMTNEAAYKFGMEAAEKSLVMVKNKDNVISKDGLSGKVYVPQKFMPAAASFFGSNPAQIVPTFGAGIEDPGFEVITDTVGEPTGDPAEGETEKQFQASDLTALTADELKDVKYAVVGIDGPKDQFQGVDGGKGFMNIIMGTPAEKEAVWKPLSLQYRPFTADADWVRKESLNPVDEDGKLENRSVFGESTTATNESDLDMVIDLKKKLPADAKLICVVSITRPMCFYELEPYCDAIIVKFGSVTDEAVAHILSGAAEPSGLLSFQMPKDMQTVFEQLEDVPRDMDPYTDSEGNTYDFCFGLNWSGVIDDDRTKTYKVAPLTEPECEWKASEEVTFE